jgi:hypothetical protein
VSTPLDGASPLAPSRAHRRPSSLLVSQSRRRPPVVSGHASRRCPGTADRERSSRVVPCGATARPRLHSREGADLGLTSSESVARSRTAYGSGDEEVFTFSPAARLPTSPSPDGEWAPSAARTVFGGRLVERAADTFRPGSPRSHGWRAVEEARDPARSQSEVPTPAKKWVPWSKVPSTVVLAPSTHPRTGTRQALGLGGRVAVKP